MKKENVLFIAMMVGEIMLFLLCGFSLIQCFVFGNFDEDLGGHIIEIIYLFIHLIATAIIFYLSFKAFKQGPSIMNNLMLDEDNNKITSKLITSGILAVLFIAVAIYSTLHVSGLNMPLLDKLSIGLAHDLMNAGYLLFLIAASLFVYPFIFTKPKEPRKYE